MSWAELGIRVVAEDQARGVLSGIGSGIGSLGPLALGAGAAVQAGLAAGAVAAFKLGESFDDAYDKIRIGTGATGEVLAGLKDDFRAVVASVPTDFEKASTAIADLNTRTGQTGPGLQELARNVLELSRLTGTDLNQNIALSTRLFGDWSVTTEEQSTALDQMFRASQASGIEVGRLMALLVQYGAPLRGFGFSMQESAALLSKWEKEGVNVELVMGSLRIATGNLARAGIPLKEGLRDLITEIAEMEDTSAATALAMEKFGARAGADMAAAIREGRFAIDEFLTAIVEGEDTILGVAEETADAAERMTMGWNRFQLALEPLGELVFNFAGTLLEAAVPAIETGISHLAELSNFLAENVGPRIETLGAIARNVLQGEFEPAFDGARDFLESDIGPSLGAFFSEQQANLSQWVEVGLPQLMTNLGKLAVEVMGWIEKEGPNFLKQLIGEWVPNFIGWVAQAAVDIIPKLWEFNGEVGIWVRDKGAPAFKDMAVALGKGLIDGVVEGLTKAKDAIGNKLAEIARGAVSFATGPKGIDAGSPSRLTRDELGIPMVTGVVQGVVDTAHLLDAAMERLVTGAVEHAQQVVHGLRSGWGLTLEEWLDLPRLLGLVAEEAGPAIVAGVQRWGGDNVGGWRHVLGLDHAEEAVGQAAARIEGGFAGAAAFVRPWVEAASDLAEEMAAAGAAMLETNEHAESLAGGINHLSGGYLNLTDAALEAGRAQLQALNALTVPAETLAGQLNRISGGYLNLTDAALAAGRAQIEALNAVAATAGQTAAAVAAIPAAYQTTYGNYTPATYGGSSQMGPPRTQSGYVGFSGRAHGGPVHAGETYLVGERGPELFVPQATGSIVPNDRMGGDAWSQVAKALEELARQPVILKVNERELARATRDQLLRDKQSMTSLGLA